MSSTLSRREFLGNTAMAGVASALDLAKPEAAHRSDAAVLERRANFDGHWKFLLDDPQGASAARFDDRAWRSLDVPHDWSIEGPFDKDAPAKGNGGYLPTGVGWYRKNFTLPAAAEGKRISLEFDGVYEGSEVWINGTSLGVRPYGFSSFAYDLTPHLAPMGSQNQVAVRVDNSHQPNCRWYSGSGIYRHTWLRITDPLHIVQWGLFVTTPSLSPESAVVEVATRIKNDADAAREFELVHEVLDPDGTVVQKRGTSHSLRAGGEETFVHSLNVSSPALWTPSSPHLYRLRASVLTGGKNVDAETTTFGMRQATFDADKGFLLNGQHVKLNGVCIHGDGGSVGTAVPERIWERRLELLKEMGCNAIRLTHNPPAPELLDMLDRMGFLVMAEAFDEWRQPKGGTPLYGYHRYFDAWSERDMTAMIERDRNHPSIVIWSAGNEVPDQIAAGGPATLERLREIIHRSDTTRPITVACDNIAAQPKATPLEFLEKMDVVGYNYADRWRDRRELYYSIDRHANPSRRFIGTESSALYGARGVYEDQADELFFEHVSNAEIEVEQFQKFIQTRDYVSGDFIWTGIDYLGEARWPNKLAATGPLDTCGFKKDHFFFYKSLWSRDTVLHILPHWNWAGKEGTVVPVTCYTNCDTVELFLNGKSLGVKGFAFPRPGMEGRYGQYPPRARALQTTGDLHLRWDVIYAPGTLVAKGVVDGKVVQTMEVQTTGPAYKLALTVDRQRIRTDPGDVAHVTVQVLDDHGRMVPTADHDITFSLSGAGRILGLDNGDPRSHEPYQGSRRRAFNGQTLVLLQSTGAGGTMVLAASSPSLAPAQIQVAGTVE